MKRIQSLPLLLLAFLGILLFACGPSKPELISIDPGFSKHISGYTSGMIYRNDAIKIQLAEPNEDLMSKNEKELNELISFEPTIEGKLLAVSNRQLEFVPNNPLAVNQFYTATFDLNEVATVDRQFKTFQFQFATRSQNMDVSFDGLRNYNSYQIEWQYITGRILLSDNEDTSLVKQTIQATLDSKSIPIKFTNQYDKYHYFRIDSIQRLDNERALAISWNGQKINSFSNGTKTIKINSLRDFSVTQVNIKDEDDQIVELVFSDPLKQVQDLNGIVQIKGIKPLTYKIQRNIVEVYLPNRYSGDFELTVNESIRNIADARMQKGFQHEIFLTKSKPKVRIKGSGNILPNSQGLIFPFEAIGLKSVDVRVIRIFEKSIPYFLQENNLDGDDELTRFGKILTETTLKLDKNKAINLEEWNAHVINLDNFIKAEPGAIYQVAIKFDKTDAICDCPANSENNNYDYDYESDYENDDSWNERYWHTYGFGGYSDWSYYDDEEDPCDNSYYYGKAVKRNILGSDLGLIFKLDEDKTSHAFVSNMINTEPIANAEIQYFDYTNQLIASGTSNDQGMVSVHLKRKPFLMIAKKGKQRGYLKLTDGRTNSLSKFDVSGEQVQKGVKGFIYAERSVWRPGDSLYINFMLQDKLNTIPSNHPVQFEFESPSGSTIYKTSTNKHVNGVYDFRTSTSDEAVTGTYKGIVTVGNKRFEKYFKIETIKPNRLKLNLKTNQGKNLDSCLLEARWLHGASAKDLNASVSMMLSPIHTAFKGFDNYVFDSPLRIAESDRQVVYDGKLDKNGKAKFACNYTEMNEAAGMMQANFISKVFEKGGNFSIDKTVDSFSPFDYYVGIKSPKESIYDQSLETDAKHVFNIIRLSEIGKKSGNGKVKVKVFKLEWKWWYDSDKLDLSQFTGRNSALIVDEKTLTLRDGIGSYTFEVKYPDYGRYLIIVDDLNGKHQTGKVINIDWPYWNRANRTSNEFAAMLTFALDKEKYKKDEDITISFPSPSEGRALVSVETSSKVIKKFWIKTTKGETVHKFKATGDMAPNAFIHITMIQPHLSTKNDLPIRMYGVLPVEVYDPASQLEPQIIMEETIRPESKATIQVNEKNGKTMTYTLSIVDEGLLDLTAFRTPNPWLTFYAREALGVKTWDMYNEVIGAYSGKMDNLYTIGGDGSAIVGNGPKANRFKPMVRHIGPFSIPAGGSKKHTISIPNYIGSVRVMVVARNEEAYGKTDKAVTVKKPLMLLANLPRVLGPGEEFELPINVFAMEKHVKNVNVSIEANEYFELLESKNKSIQFSEVGDQLVYFKMRVKKEIGIGKLKINAKSGNETAYEAIECDIRPSNPVTTESSSFVIEQGASKEITLSMDGFFTTNAASLELSTIPGLNLEERLNYLIQYPHGCLEQTTSSVFPQLFLNNLIDLKETEKEVIEANVKAGIKKLYRFQNFNGSFSYWPGENYANEWGTNYAGHFMLAAEYQGYRLPVNMKSRWIEYQKEAAINWTSDRNYKNRVSTSNAMTQAYRLLLLAMANSPEIGAMNRLKEEPELPIVAQWQLAAAYALNGQTEVANSIISKLPTEVIDYKELSGSFGSKTRDEAIILLARTLINDSKSTSNLVHSISSKLRSNKWMSTQETSYSLLALATHFLKENKAISSTVSIQVDNGVIQKSTINKSIEKIAIKELKGKTKRVIKLSNTGKSKVYISSTVKKINKTTETKSFSNGIGISVLFTDFDGNTIDVKNLKQGTEFVANITVKNTTASTYYQEMALTQIFPPGWEINNSRLFGSSDEGNDARHFDIRDDRVNIYYSLNPNKSKTYKVQLTATFEGKYFLPNTYSEAMYDATINGQFAGQWVTVK